MEAKCKAINVPSLSIIGPVMQLFHAYLGAPTTGRIGAQHTLNAEYFKRIDALNYTAEIMSVSCGPDDGADTGGAQIEVSERFGQAGRVISRLHLWTSL
jgi:regulator of PEP synthase PpsR (kinase-PPPase family)